MATVLRRFTLVAIGGAALLLAGCRGMPSRQPPVHLQQNMDAQARLEAQETWNHFADGRAMRLPVEGTVARGSLRLDEHLDHGKVRGQHARTLPDQVPLTRELVRRGQQRYEIYCAPCHDSAGTGQGTVVARGMLQPPSLHDPRVQAFPLGEIYNVITNGVRNMPAYGPQVPVEDRWAIATYVRALQRSRAAGLPAVPADVRQAMGWAAPAGSEEVQQ